MWSPTLSCPPSNPATVLVHDAHWVPWELDMSQGQGLRRVLSYLLSSPHWSRSAPCPVGLPHEEHSSGEAAFLGIPVKKTSSACYIITLSPVFSPSLVRHCVFWVWSVLKADWSRSHLPLWTHPVYQLLLFHSFTS